MLDHTGVPAVAGDPQVGARAVTIPRLLMSSKQTARVEQITGRQLARVHSATFAMCRAPIKVSFVAPVLFPAGASVVPLRFLKSLPVLPRCRCVRLLHRALFVFQWLLRRQLRHEV